MQHPVGVTVQNGRPVLTDIGAVLTNSTAIAAFSHAIAGSLVVAGGLAVAIGIYHLHRDSADVSVWRSSVRIGGIVSMVAFGALAITGDQQGKLMYAQQPLKMSSAEALCETSAPAPLSVFAIGRLGGDCDDVTSWTVPGLLSFLAHNDFHSAVPGVPEVQQEYRDWYGATYPDDPKLGSLAGAPIDYQPRLEVTYWGFRLMIAGGAFTALVAAWALWRTRKGRRPRSRWEVYAGIAGVAAPLAGNAAGWIFTEMGRQPFVVVPNPDVPLDQRIWFFTAQAVSPGLSVGEVVTSLVLLTAVYAVLAVVEIGLIARFARRGTGPQEPPPTDPSIVDGAEDDVLSLAY
jgi:cytochrome d ubiquinol oxidase subunit I